MAEATAEQEDKVPSSISVLPSRLRVIDVAAKLAGKSRSDYLVDAGEDKARADLSARGIDPDTL